jgi:hypothetical protein
MMRNIFNSLVALLVTFVVSAQTPAIGQWRDHLPYSYAIAVAEATDRIYCAAPGGIFALVKADNSIEKLSRTNGLTDVTVQTLNVNPYNNKLVIGYRNGNIDVISNKVITNVPDIKNASLVGNKIINSIYFINQYAYLCTGFGIVVFDTDRMEIKDTYYIGNNSTFVNVLDITSDGISLYAATTTCIYTASLSNPNLDNFASWTILTGGGNVHLPTGNFNQIAAFGGVIYMNYSAFNTSNLWQKDTIYTFNPTSNIWSKTFEQGIVCLSMRAGNGYLVVGHEDHIEVFDATITDVNFIYAFSFGGFPIANQAIKSSTGLDVWIADRNNGMVRCVNSSLSYKYFPNGPRRADVYSMDYRNGEISVAPGAHADNWGNMYNTAGLSTFLNEQWTTEDRTNVPILGTAYDFIATAIDPSTPNHVFYGSLGFGVFEFNNGTLGTMFGKTNSTLKTRQGDTTYVGVSGMAYDANNNLWMTNMLTNTLINCREPNGTWHAYDCSSVIANVEVGPIIVGQNGIKWAILPRSRGILLYDDRGTLSNTSDDRLKRLTFAAGSGGITGTEVFAIAEDKNQQVWVGTDAGICVFYNPDNMFNASGFDAQTILVQQGVHTQLLMENEEVNAIAIDGANRKWIGTQSGGVFLMSADGTQQIYNFNKDNSPLISNTILSITINQKTGEVFFGTDQGIVSYRSTATEGTDSFGDVYAFPNPVKHDYEGVVAIKGLTTDAEVKITDISGNLIFQTTALGGQAIWDGKNFKGERAHTGVYIVFCSNTDGSQTYVTKILFIN